MAKAFQIKSAIEMLLEARPSLKRDKEDLDELDKANIFTRDEFVIQDAPAVVKKQPIQSSSSSSSSSSSTESREEDN